MNAGVLYFQTAYDRMGGRVKHHSGPHFHSQQANAEVKRLLFPSNNVNIISKFHSHLRTPLKFLEGRLLIKITLCWR